MGLRTYNLSEQRQGQEYALAMLVDLDNSYPSGGYPLDFGLLPGSIKRISSVEIEGKGGYLFEYDHLNKKLVVKYPTSAATSTTRRITQTWPGLKGSANTDSENADAAALPTNGAAVAALAAVAAGAWAVGAITNPGYARNVCIVIKNPTGGALNLYEGVMTFTITGTYRGAAQSETVTFTSTAGNKSVATTKFRYKYGSKPFDTVTGITLDNVPADALEIAAGLGSKLALTTDLKTPAEADVIKLVKNGAYLAVTGLVDTANGTVNFGVLADADSAAVTHLASSVAAVDVAAVASEAAAAADLSGITELPIRVTGLP